MENNKKLAIALGSELNMQVDGMEEKFKSILIGIESPNYLMVRMQIPTQFRNQIDEGTTFMVRYVYMGHLYGFKTKSLGSVENPCRVTFLSYPSIVESLNIRKAQRVSCFIPATIELGIEELRGLIMKISKSGIRFSLKTNKYVEDDVKINSSVTIIFPLLGFEGIHKIKGIIKSVANDAGGTSFGIQFKEIGPSIENMIEKYVRDVLDII